MGSFGRPQKGLNKSRNHHDGLSQSGIGRAKHDSHSSGLGHSGSSGFSSPGRTKSGYGQGKHSKGGKPKQLHW